jgi:hypothetical protein
LILIKEGNLDLVVNRFQGEVLAELSQEYNLEKLIKSIEELNLVQRNLEQNVNPKLALENYFLNL